MMKEWGTNIPPNQYFNTVSCSCMLLPLLVLLFKIGLYCSTAPALATKSATQAPMVISRGQEYSDLQDAGTTPICMQDSSCLSELVALQSPSQYDLGGIKKIILSNKILLAHSHII